MKLSEKSKTRLKCRASGPPKRGFFGPFWLLYRAKHMLGALLVALFRQFQGEVQHSLGQRAQDRRRGSLVPMGIVFLMYTLIGLWSYT